MTRELECSSTRLEFTAVQRRGSCRKLTVVPPRTRPSARATLRSISRLLCPQRVESGHTSQIQEAWPRDGSKTADGLIGARASPYCAVQQNLSCSSFVGSCRVRSLSDTLERLRKLPRMPVGKAPTSSRLRAFGGFGTNPGQLNAWVYVPESARPGAALVVVLHGCTQNAAGYDASSGWSRLAERHGFVLLYPEQQRHNNPNLCFNWFSADDAARGKGEAASIERCLARSRAAMGQIPSACS